MGVYGKTGYSAEVRLHLRVNGEMIPVSHTEPESIILRSHYKIPSGPATLVINIDGRIIERKIILRDPEDDAALELSYSAAPSDSPFQ